MAQGITMAQIRDAQKLIKLAAAKKDPTYLNNIFKSEKVTKAITTAKDLYNTSSMQPELAKTKVNDMIINLRNAEIPINTEMKHLDPQALNRINDQAQSTYSSMSQKLNALKRQAAIEVIPEAQLKTDLVNGSYSSSYKTSGSKYERAIASIADMINKKFDELLGLSQEATDIDNPGDYLMLQTKLQLLKDIIAIMTAIGQIISDTRSMVVNQLFRDPHIAYYS